MSARNKQKQRRRTGRPTVYSAELGQQICALLAEGKTLNAAWNELARQVPILPARPTILAWANDPEHPFSAMYARARLIGYQLMADDLIDIADAEEGIEGKTVDPGIVQRDRLRVETRKWVLAKALPRVYGDRSEINVTANHTHHLVSEPISETDRWLEGLYEPAAQIEAQEPVPD